MKITERMVEAAREAFDRPPCGSDLHDCGHPEHRYWLQNDYERHRCAIEAAMKARTV